MSSEMTSRMSVGAKARKATTSSGLRSEMRSGAEKVTGQQCIVSLALDGANCVIWNSVSSLRRFPMNKLRLVLLFLGILFVPQLHAQDPLDGLWQGYDG